MTENGAIDLLQSDPRSAPIVGTLTEGQRLALATVIAAAIVAEGVRQAEATREFLAPYIKELEQRSNGSSAAPPRYEYLVIGTWSEYRGGPVHHVVVGVDAMGTRKVLANRRFQIESSGSWTEMFREIGARGLPVGLRMITCQNRPGILDALARWAPSVPLQYCIQQISGRVGAVAMRLPPAQRQALWTDYRRLRGITVQADAIQELAQFTSTWGPIAPRLGFLHPEVLTYLGAPRHVRRHLSTTLVIPAVCSHRTQP